MCSNATLSSEKAGLQGYTENKHGGRKTLNGRPRMNEAHTYFFYKKLLTRTQFSDHQKIKKTLVLEKYHLWNYLFLTKEIFDMFYFMSLVSSIIILEMFLSDV